MNNYSIETEMDAVISSEDSVQKGGKKGFHKSKTHVHMGRVTRVVNDISIQSGAINFIFVSGKGKNKDSNARANKDGGGSLALPLFPGFRNLPLKNEFVFIIPSVANAKMPVTSYFYISAVNTFNTGVYNPDADELDLIKNNNIDLGKGIIETNLDKLRKLLLFPGDTSLEGRFGNTIRLGNSNIDTPYEGKQNSPITIIRNGQKDTQGSLTPVSEDINKDNSSIYLTKGQTIPIDVISKNMQTFGVEEKNTTTGDDIQKLEGKPEDIDNTDVSATVIKDSGQSDDRGDNEYSDELMSERYPLSVDNDENFSSNSNDEAFAEEGENVVFNDTSTDFTSNAEAIIKKYKGYTIKRVLSSDSYGNPEQITEHYVIPNIGVESLFDESDSTATSYFTNIIEELIISGDIKDLTT